MRSGPSSPESGWGIMTGGYSGLMGAAADGARSRGGSARGLPMTAWAQLTPDPAHDDLAWCATYGERLDHIARADVLVALPGGVRRRAGAAEVGLHGRLHGSHPRRTCSCDKVRHEYALQRRLIFSARDAWIHSQQVAEAPHCTVGSEPIARYLSGVALSRRPG